MIYTLGDRAPVFEGAGHFVADNATIIGSVRLGDKASVWFNVILRGDNDWLVVGARSNIQDGSVLHTDPGLELAVGAGVTVGHKAMLHGCAIGDNSLIGIGSTVLNGARIGRDCIVGAHALVTEGKEFPDGSLILGAPAKVVRQLEDEEIAQIGASADHYVDNAARYNSGLVPGG
ncbi:MAG: gamma carbonic anhydrase family protein [Gammaproteobacteria bacterium]|nr:gamma carbonic anhydrase family protein [Gammaproteobacteria bacterium]NNF48234.1 gamma carbonic anhydrase family protein [Woeseiaceae bacterium]MBT8094272.1 gamma carbonic anhydrase family protein [Gammaproteobacteria bacterium]MBT8104533.1 gamma carbonic anhydrase family protein [Gammaproteobacteria bacterium]NNK24547.1 gamma carbonic anhydrase family protein [Woeseiaceae bacterium]